MTERAKLWRDVVATGAIALSVGCGAELTQIVPAPTPVYDPRSRQLQRLDWDENGDGRIDHRTYFVAGTAVRTEIDSNGDRRVDRWEYVAADAALRFVGSASAVDGIEDTWAWAADREGEVLIERAQYRDRTIDRREYLRDDVLVRVEEDSNRDGAIDKWETWKDGVLIEAAFDTRLGTGRPDRRLSYERGRFAYMETDVDGDGRFERIASNQPGLRRREP